MRCAFCLLVVNVVVLMLTQDFTLCFRWRCSVWDGHIKKRNQHDERIITWRPCASGLACRNQCCEPSPLALSSCWLLNNHGDSRLLLAHWAAGALKVNKWFWYVWLGFRATNSCTCFGHTAREMSVFKCPSVTINVNRFTCKTATKRFFFPL